MLSSSTVSRWWTSGLFERGDAAVCRELAEVVARNPEGGNFVGVVESLGPPQLAWGLRVGVHAFVAAIPLDRDDVRAVRMLEAVGEAMQRLRAAPTASDWPPAADEDDDGSSGAPAQLSIADRRRAN